MSEGYTLGDYLASDSTELPVDAAVPPDLSARTRLAAIADQLKSGKEPEPEAITVRTLLSWFGAQRRGSFIVYWIRRMLREFGLRTDPDFQSEWIDSTLRFVLASPTSASEKTEGQAPVDSPLLVGGAIADPAHKVGKLDAANRGVVFVAPDDPLTKAVTLMLSKNFSQLPIMASEREVKGIISWAGIATRAALGKSCDRVRDCTERAQEVGSDTSLFSVIPYIAEHQYVLVRDSKDKRITGIITASDLSLQFQQLAEPFLLLGEIEHHIRRLLEHRFTETELSSAKDPGETERKIASVADLSLGECTRLLENEEKWRKVGLTVDRVVFIRDLHKVRSIRNDVMHFDPDPLTTDDLQELRSFVRFLETLWEIGVAQKPAIVGGAGG
jgi:CBS domain-containing protein